MLRYDDMVLRAVAFSLTPLFMGDERISLSLSGVADCTVLQIPVGALLAMRSHRVAA